MVFFPYNFYIPIENVMWIENEDEIQKSEMILLLGIRWRFQNCVFFFALELFVIEFYTFENGQRKTKQENNNKNKTKAKFEKSPWTKCFLFFILRMYTEFHKNWSINKKNRLWNQVVPLIMTLTAEYPSDRKILRYKYWNEIDIQNFNHTDFLRHNFFPFRFARYYFYEKNWEKYHELTCYFWNYLSFLIKISLSECYYPFTAWILFSIDFGEVKDLLLSSTDSIALLGNFFYDAFIF